MVKENLKMVEENIRKACERSNRDPKEVTLIAVSKTKPVEMIREAIDYGMKDYGENKVQEMCDKISVIPEKLNWHLIGHLQRNKVKMVIDKACLIHSVDSIRLAKQISEEAVKKNITVQILLEVNVAEEESKYGFSTEETEVVLREIAAMPNILVRGLMTSAPYTENSEENRQFFRTLKQLCVDLKAKNIDNTSMDYLSMGMTGDFEVAIEEGATHVRVGTAIFGERDYNI